MATRTDMCKCNHMRIMHLDSKGGRSVYMTRCRKCICRGYNPRVPESRFNAYMEARYRITKGLTEELIGGVCW